MMMNRSKKTKSNAATTMSLSIAAALAAMVSTPASAFKFDTGHDDVELNWDTTVRYNAGWRMEPVNSHFANASGTDETELVFKKNQMMLNRLDIYTEADFLKRGPDYKYGARISASIWSERAYGNNSNTNPAITNGLAFGFLPMNTPSNYGPGGPWSDYTKRYITGTSGEFNDAFVFGGMQLGETNLDVKLGQHNVYWGDSFILAQNSVAHMQGPTDSVKGLMSPGIDAKEAYMPLNRISGSWTTSPTLSVVGEYTFDWKPGRGASAGTYFSSSDVTGARFARALPTFAGGQILLVDPVTPGRKGGDYGIGVRWIPSFDKDSGSMGFYYRKYDEKTQWGVAATCVGSAACPGGLNPSAPANTTVRFVYPRDTELYGLTYSTRFGSVSTGMEFSYRKNAALSGNPSVVGNFSAGAPTYQQLEGARGNTTHYLLNGVYLLPSSSLWETGNLLVELGYVHLEKVTKNRNQFNGVGYPGCAAGRSPADGCATKDNMTVTAKFTPQWFGVLPSVDLSVPISFTSVVFGNNPTNGTADNEGVSSWSIGAIFNYKSVYEFAIQYSDRYQRYSTKTAAANGSEGVPGATIVNTANGPLANQNNHGWLNVRFKTTF